MKVIAPSITCWAVKAQVNKIWKTIDNVNGSAIGRFEMVLFDNQVSSYFVYILFEQYLWKTLSMPYTKLNFCME